MFSFRCFKVLDLHIGLWYILSYSYLLYVAWGGSRSAFFCIVCWNFYLFLIELAWYYCRKSAGLMYTDLFLDFSSFFLFWISFHWSQPYWLLWFYSKTRGQVARVFQPCLSRIVLALLRPLHFHIVLILNHQFPFFFPKTWLKL